MTEPSTGDSATPTVCVGSMAPHRYARRGDRLRVVGQCSQGHAERTRATLLADPEAEVRELLAVPDACAIRAVYDSSGDQDDKAFRCLCGGLGILITPEYVPRAQARVLVHRESGWRDAPRQPSRWRAAVPSRSAIPSPPPVGRR